MYPARSARLIHHATPLRIAGAAGGSLARPNLIQSSEIPPTSCAGDEDVVLHTRPAGDVHGTTLIQPHHRRIAKGSPAKHRADFGPAGHRTVGMDIAVDPDFHRALFFVSKQGFKMIGVMREADIGEFDPSAMPDVEDHRPHRRGPRMPRVAPVGVVEPRTHRVPA